MFNSKVHKFFTLAKFRNVTNWSVSHILGMNVGFNEKYPMVMIGDIITRSAETVNIEDDKDYRQVTLKTNGGGAVQRKDGIKKGKEIGTKKQYIVHTDQFIMSKIDARNGAFGVIGSDLEGSIVTADFPVFDVDKSKVLPEYLKLISSTSRFVEFAKSCSSGTTNRQRIDVKQFLLQQIPLPSLDVQKRLVASYNNKLQQAEDFELKTQELKKKIEDYLQKTLGVSSPKGSSETEKNSSSQKCRFLNFVKFKNIDRWDVSCFSKESRIVGKYENFTIGECVEFFMEDSFGNSLRTETSKYPKDDFQYVGMECVEKNTGFLSEKRIVKGQDIKSQTLRVPSNFFLYGKLRPYLNKYWRNENNGDNVVCSSEFFVFSIKPSINSDYFKCYISSNLVQNQIANSFSGARMPRINEDVFKAIMIPIPPQNIQEKIAVFFVLNMKLLNEMKKHEFFLKENALIDFEQEVFA